MADIEKILKALDCEEYRKCGECPYVKFGKCNVLLIRDVREKLTENGWIPVSKKKPRSMANKVIVYLQNEDYVPQIGYGHYEKFQGEEMWYNLENNEQFSKRGYTVTHWMPMPKSPEGEALILY